jgi:hypothetical protein
VGVDAAFAEGVDDAARSILVHADQGSLLTSVWASATSGAPSVAAAL